MSRKAIAVLLSIAVSMFSAAATAQQDASVDPQPMPTGFDYPTPGYVIEQWVSNGEVATVRAHAWDIWNAMSQPSGQYYHGSDGTRVELPVWDTWQSDNELFNTPTPVSGSDGRTLHPFHLAHQQTHLVPTGEPVGDLAISFNKFDPSAAAFILTEQPAPDGSGRTFPINSKTGLEALNATWPNGTPPGVRAIRDFPETAIETKPVFLPVLADQLTAVPLWQGVNQATNPKNPTPETWFRCVLVDARNRHKAMREAKLDEIKGAAIAKNFNCKNYLYAPLDLYYSVMLDKAGAEGFNGLQTTTMDAGIKVSAGDYAALNAMHVNTKEMDRWTWQTYYWQGNATYDVNFPGSLGDAPADLKAPWNSYAVCTAYDQIVAGKQVVCFNPFLETSPGIPDGINSNCVSCHGMARAGDNVAPVYPPTYTNHHVFPIPVQFDDPRLFGGVTKTDFSWAVGGSGSGTTIPK